MIINDPHSYAKPNEVVVKHLSLNLEVDFNAKQLKGYATWDIENKSDADKIIFDTRGLTIDKVLLNGNEPATYQSAEIDSLLGSTLTVHCNANTKQLSIYYSTSSTADALQWLDPEQTAGKKFPFLFTQSQAILARTWVPCQDSPGIRFTYDATIKVPKQMMAVMSAENPQQLSSDGIYHFRMKQPIPSYLLALSAGNLSFHAFDDRTGVYAEPETMKQCVYEFGDLPKMVKAAEDLYGPYAWGRYDLLMLPPSFPFGGMENPRLTFATPTILAGDRSLTSLVAHELAHSWSGNLVTNATWDDFWMNEGFTVYFEYRIMESLYGKDFAEMLRFGGQQDLKETIVELGSNSDDTKLKLNLTGRDPDDGMNDIAYEKGNNLLTWIERNIGRERFDTFLKNYFKEYSFKTITTEEFIGYFKQHLIAGDTSLENKLNINEWIYRPGLPNSLPVFKSELFEKVDADLQEWLAGKPLNTLTTKSYSAFEWIHFLRALPVNLKEAKLTELDHTFHFSQSGNAEIRFAWLELALSSQYKPAYPAAEEFLVGVGRRKFVKPLFVILVRTPEGKQLAEKIYLKARANYHSVTRNTVEDILKKAS